jgi:hypothetical protein
MSKHERLRNRHCSHHLVLGSPRVFVRNCQKFADLTYDVIFTHWSLITVFVSRQTATHRLTTPFFGRRIALSCSKTLKRTSPSALTWRPIFNSIRCVSG